MNRVLKKIGLLAATAALVCGAVGAFSACGPAADDPMHKHTFATEWSFDDEYHWHAATCEHKEEVADRAAHTFSGDSCTVCGYERESVTPQPGGDNQPGSGTTYVFEAECTDLGHKTGLGYSGDASGRNMVQGNNASNASGGGWVGYLYADGVAVGFVIESDREVTDATLSLRIACEYVNMTFNSDNYKIRVDYDLTEDDLADYEDYWGEFYQDVPEGDAEIKYSDIALTKGGMVPQFADYVVTTQLTLHEGLNMISLVTNNTMLAQANLGTMKAIAPMVDCIKITTDAVLDMAVVVDNGFGTDGCYQEN